MNGRKQINVAGGCPAASYLSCLAKKGNPKKAPPACRPCGVPCVARLVRQLRNSHDPLRVHVLKQSSPKSPDQPALLGGAQGNEKQMVWYALRARFCFVVSVARATLTC
jgi:hypothetical protein